MQIQNRKIGSQYPPFIIAEAGINHNGDLLTALRMVNAAVKAGADCIKFQTHIADKEMLPSHPLYESIKKCQLSEEDEIKLREYCDKYEIIFLSTPYCKEAVDRLDNMGVSAYKIGSGECNNLPLVEYIAKKGKPVILSTGMVDNDEVEQAVEILVEYDCDFMLNHCISGYPTSYRNMNLREIEDLIDFYGDIPIGISDHSVGIYTALGAIALGAVAVEKHFMLDDEPECPDALVSITSLGLRELVKGSRAIWEAMHGENIDLSQENETKKWAFHSIVTKRDVKKGEMLGNDNLTTKRCGNLGIPASTYATLLGKIAKIDIKANIMLELEDICG